MKPICNKCEWHHLREGYSYNWRTGEEQHHIMIDVCIHPILDDLKHTNFKGDKEYHVETITYNWQEHLGQALINYFSVNCAGQMYQISFNNTTFRWQIDKIIS